MAQHPIWHQAEAQQVQFKQTSLVGAPPPPRTPALGRPLLFQSLDGATACSLHQAPSFNLCLVAVEFCLLTARPLHAQNRTKFFAAARSSSRTMPKRDSLWPHTKTTRANASLQDGSLRLETVTRVSILSTARILRLGCYAACNRLVLASDGAAPSVMS